ncbi:MAG: hypothetical protein WD066_04950 [Planctomycetaceae bacterium]
MHAADAGFERVDFESRAFGRERERLQGVGADAGARRHFADPISRLGEGIDRPEQRPDDRPADRQQPDADLLHARAERLELRLRGPQALHELGVVGEQFDEGATGSNRSGVDHDSAFGIGIEESPRREGS